jgi:glycosyltransferase involved in cell wall biosynthesis
LIRAEKVDIVHTFCPASELIALLATRCARLARVLGVRRNVGYWHTMGTLWRARLAGRLGARYAANCEAARRFTARREWISPRRIAVIPNPLSESRIREGLAAVPTRQALGLCDGEQTVGIVASVRPIKDHATFFRAARLVLDRHPRTRFLVIGHSRSWDRRDLDALIEQLGIGSQVCWMSEVANPVTVLPHFEVGVLSSLSEGFSNALLEYAAAGIPAVATDVGGTREVVVDKETGFLVPPQRPEFMARRICELLESPERRRQMGENARRRAETVFSQQAVLSAYDRLYARLARREEIA